MDTETWVARRSDNSRREGRRFAPERAESLHFNTAQHKALIKVYPVVTPYLASLGADYYVGGGISTYVCANNTLNCFDPGESVREFYAMLTKKIDRTYG